MLLSDIKPDAVFKFQEGIRSYKMLKDGTHYQILNNAGEGGRIYKVSGFHRVNIIKAARPWSSIKIGTRFMYSRSIATKINYKEFTYLRDDMIFRGSFSQGTETAHFMILRRRRHRV